MTSEPSSPPREGVLIRDLAVIRSGRPVLQGLNLSVAPGTVYALLGGNGAGKSTTLFALLGLLKRSAGQARVAGIDPQHKPQAVRAACAYLAENVALYEHLSARENVGYFLDLAGQKRSRAAIEEAFSAVRLAEAAWDKRLGAFSKGMRQKTALALALLRDTPVLLLDEPTSGLDPAATADFHILLNDLKARGVAILMVTHDLFGAAESADAIGLIEGGRLAQEWRREASGYDAALLYRAFRGRVA